MTAIYQNQKSYDVVLPTPNGGGITIPRDGFVGGSYFEFLEWRGILVQVDENNVALEQVTYYYPEYGFPFSGATAITTLNTSEGLEGGGSGPTLTIGIADDGVTTDKIADAAITSDKIATGNLVTSLNNLTDGVHIAAGVGLSITPAGNTLLLANISPGLSNVSATAPVVGSLSSGNTILSLSLNVTATNDGGAIAKQAAFPSVLQTGHVGLNGNVSLSGRLYSGYNASSDTSTAKLVAEIDSSDPAPPNLLELKSSGTNLFEVTATGATTLTNTLTALEIIAPELTIGTTNFVVSDVSILIGLPTTVIEEITLDSINGRITNNPLVNPALELYVDDADPAILIKQESGSTLDDCVFLDIQDENNNSLFKLEKDGILTVNKLIASSVVGNFIYINSASTYNVSLSSPETLICDSSNGNIILQLPTIPSDYTGSVEIVAKKVDISNNTVSLVPNTGQFIDGVLNTPYLLDDYESVRLVGFYEVNSDTEVWFTV